MKKTFCLILAFLLFSYTAAFAQTWHTANQATVAWDATTYQLDPGERLVYRVYLANAKTDPGKANPSLIGDTENLEYTITLATKGSYFFGAKSVVQVEINGVWEDVAESAIGWSDDPSYAQAGETFGLRFYPAPGVPGGMRPVTQ